MRILTQNCSKPALFVAFLRQVKTTRKTKGTRQSSLTGRGASFLSFAIQHANQGRYGGQPLPSQIWNTSKDLESSMIRQSQLSWMSWTTYSLKLSYARRMEKKELPNLVPCGAGIATEVCFVEHRLGAGFQHTISQQIINLIQAIYLDTVERLGIYHWASFVTRGRKNTVLERMWSS